MRPLLMPALLLALALAASGCASDDPADTNTQTSSPTTTGDGGSSTDAPTEPGTPGPATEHSCTAEPGSVIGLQGPAVAGCDLVTLDAASVLVSIDVPGGCTVLYDETGDGMSDGSAVAGDSYDADTLLFMACDAVNATAEGTVAVAKAA